MNILVETIKKLPSYSGNLERYVLTLGSVTFPSHLLWVMLLIRFDVGLLLIRWKEVEKTR